MEAVWSSGKESNYRPKACGFKSQQRQILYNRKEIFENAVPEVATFQQQLFYPAMEK